MRIVHVTECLAGGILTFIRSLTEAMPAEEHILVYSDRPNTPKDVRACFGGTSRSFTGPMRGASSCRRRISVPL